MKNVVMYVEHRAGQTRKVTYELATQARQIADSLGGSAHAVVLGAGAQGVGENLAAYPLDTIHVCEDAHVDRFLLDPSVDYLEAAIREIGPSLVLVANTMLGRDIAGRLSVRLDAGLASDVTGFSLEGGTVACVAPKLGGAQITTCAFKPADFGVVTVRPNSFSAKAGGSGAKVEQLAPIGGKSYAMVVEDDVEEASGEMGLEEAPAIVAGGRGLGGGEPFETLLKPLADALGGAVGASRAAADAGWVPYSLQIGQTGKVVSPALYIAVGISGAIQHKVGMRSAGTIVAINKDGTAPIIDFSDLVVVGDAFQIVPALTQMVQDAKAHA